MNYAYKKPSGEIHWLSQPVGATPPPVTLEVDGVTATRSYQAERVGVPATQGWPMECIASGVNAEDAQKLRDEFDRVGVPTEVTRDGDPIYRNAAHRKRALKARGLHDRLAYY